VIFESGAVATGGTPSGSGGAGTDHTAGTSGSGASSAGATAGAGAAGAAGAPNAIVVDDFEDGDTLALEPAGWWYTVNDDSSSQSLSIEQDSLRQSGALHTVGAGFTGWGAALGVNLNELPLDPRLRVLRFSARSASGRDVALQVIDKDGLRFTHTLTVTSAWQEYSVRLDQLYTAQGDAFVPLDVSQLNTLHWFFFGGDAFDVWLDDVVFAPE
jgi:hypothetical protein